MTLGSLMRPFAIALLAATSCASPIGPARPPAPAKDVGAAARPNVDSARELDQEGVRAFREGRYADAIRYFRSAYRLGGPPSELWNVARAHEKLDDPEAAAGAIDEYLALRDLSPRDRAEAERELRALRSRPSVLTVTTTPSGALVTIDGRAAPGATPISIEIGPGAHTIGIRMGGYVAQTHPLEARFGRAVIVSLDLARADK